MAAKDLFFDDGGNGEAVEDVSEGFPNVKFATELALAFVEETINAADLRRFMVASKKKEILRISNLESEK